MAKQTLEIEEIYSTAKYGVYQPSLRVDFKGGRCALNKAALALLQIADKDRISIVKFKGIDGYLICNSGEEGKPIVRNKECGNFYAHEWKQKLFEKHSVNTNSGKSIICKIDEEPVIDTEDGVDYLYYKIIVP